MGNLNLDKVKSELEPFQYVQELFDPIQTHAVYDIRSKNDLDVLKFQLKRTNVCTRFRQVKSSGDNYILCFKLKKDLVVK